MSHSYLISLVVWQNSNVLFRLSIINRKKSPSERDLKRYEQLDALKEKLVQAAPYTLIQVDDEAMGISSDDTPDRKV